VRHERACAQWRVLPTMRAASPIVLGAGALLFCSFGAAYAVPVFFPALSQALAVPLPHLTALYPVHARIRKPWGEMIRKLSVTSSQ
jgi:hypothetical protein